MTFTNLRWVPPQNDKDLAGAISNYWLSLEKKGALAIQPQDISHLPIVHVDDYINPAATDHTSGIRAAVTRLTALGGGVLSFGQGKTYTVFTGGASQDKLCEFTSLNGIKIQGNGATLDSALANPAFVLYFFLFTDCSRISVENLKIVGSNSGLDPNNGEHAFFLQQADQVCISNCQALNCLTGVALQGTQQNNITVENLYAHTTYYPLTCNNSKGVRASLFTVNAGRSYFCRTNNHDHDVTVNSEPGGPFTDCLLEVLTDHTKSVEYNSLSNIRLNYFTKGRYSGSGDQGVNAACIGLEALQGTSTSTAANFRNITINFHVDCLSGDQFYDIIQTKRWNNTPDPDTADRSHVYTNITISGTAINAGNLLGSGIRLFDKMAATTNGPCDYVNDLATAIHVRDVRIIGTPPTDGLYINGEPAVSGKKFVTVTNCEIEGATTLANHTSARIEGVPIATTPGVSFNGGTTGLTYTTQTGSAVVRDGIVSERGVIVINSNGTSTGAARITGLRHAVRNNNDSVGAVSIAVAGVTYTGMIQGVLEANAAAIVLQSATEAGGTTNLDDTNIGDGDTIYYTAVYRAF